MSEQLKYALKQTAILVGIAVLGVVADQLSTFNLDATTGLIAATVVAGLLQVLNGLRDAKRAELGEVLPRDVGFDEIDELRSELYQTTADLMAARTIAKAKGATLADRIAYAPYDYEATGQ